MRSPPAPASMLMSSLSSPTMSLAFKASLISASFIAARRLLITVENPLDPVKRHAAVRVIIHDHDRSKTAGAQASHGLQRKSPVFGGLTHFKTQFLGQDIHDVAWCPSRNRPCPGTP